MRRDGPLSALDHIHRRVVSSVLAQRAEVHAEECRRQVWNNNRRAVNYGHDGRIRRKKEPVAS
ncbi:hypothetical protein BDQ12DRAFT_674775, partial [Crucibulum laeve]